MSADVRSIADLRDYHAALGAYRDTLRAAMGGVEMEVRRAFDWLQDQKALWQRRAGDAEDEVVRAKAELAARKFPGYDGRMPDTTVQEENLRRAKAKLEYCLDQADRCKTWISKLPKQVEEAYTGPARRLINFLEAELPSGLGLLARRIGALEAYSEVRTDFAPTPSAAALPTAPPPAASPPPGNAAAGQEG